MGSPMVELLPCGLTCGLVVVAPLLCVLSKALLRPRKRARANITLETVEFMGDTSWLVATGTNYPN